MKELIQKRDGLIKQAEQMREKLNEEKRTSFNADERTAFDKVKNEITEIGSRISDEQFLENEKRNEAVKHFSKEEKKLNSQYNIGRALKNKIAGKALDGAELEGDQEAERELLAKGLNRSHPNAFLIPSFVAEQRATNTVSSQSSLVKANLLDNVSMVQYPVIYSNIAQVWQDVPNGSFLIPSLQNVIAAYATTDSTASDIALTSAVKTLAPKWMQSGAGFTKDFLASATESMQSQLFAFMKYSLERATDKQMFYDMTGATTAQVFVTASTNTYKGVLKLVNGIPYANAFICSKRGSTFLQTTPTISGSTSNAQPIWSASNQVAGIDAYASFDSPNGLYAVGDFRSSYHVPVWSNSLSLLVDPFTESRKGNIILQVSRCQNQGIGNLQAFSIGTNGSFV